MAPFYGWGSTASKLEPLWGGSLLFTTKFPEISVSHFTDLGRMKDWVDLGATHWFWTRDPWIGNPAPWPLGHCSMKFLFTYKNFVFFDFTWKKFFCSRNWWWWWGVTGAPLPHLSLQPWDDISWKVLLDQLWRPNFFGQLLAPPTPNSPPSFSIFFIFTSLNMQ